MAITTMDGLVAALATSQDQKLFFPSATNAAGGFISLNRAVVTSFGQSAIPAVASSGGTIPTESLLGYPTFNNPSAPALSYVGRIGSVLATAGTVHVYDSLWSCSGFNGTLTTAQAVTSMPALTRPDANGEGAEIWIQCYTATGATASNITVQYTNQSGVASRSTVSTAMIVSMPANRMFQVPLQSGDTGVRSIQSVTLSASTATAGNFGVTLMRRICSFGGAVPNVPNPSDFAALGLPEVLNDAALTFVHQATTTSSGVIMGQLSLIQG